jgi:GAF domain-containing protein
VSPATGGANPYSGIIDIAAAIVSNLSWQETFNVVAEKIGGAMFAWSASLNSYDDERDAVTYEAYWCEGGASEEDLDYIGHVSFLADRPDFRPLIESRELTEVHIDDPGVSAVERDVMKKWGLKTTLDGPLVFDDKVIGTVGVAETRFIRRFTPSELDFFSQLCELAAIGIHNAQEARQRRKMERRFTALTGLASELATAVTTAEVEAAVGTAAEVALACSQTLVKSPRAGLEQPLVEKAADPELGERERAELAQDEAAVRLLVPVALAGESRRLLAFSWGDEHHHVTEIEIETARLIAAQAALAVTHPLFGGRSDAPG